MTIDRNPIASAGDHLEVIDALYRFGVGVDPSTAIRFPDMCLEPDASVPEIPHCNLSVLITLSVLLK